MMSSRHSFGGYLQVRRYPHYRQCLADQLDFTHRQTVRPKKRLPRSTFCMLAESPYFNFTTLFD